jgi:hypothetical protein
MARWTQEGTPFDLLKDIKEMTAAMASTLFFTNDESHRLAPLLDDVLAALSAYPSPFTGATYRTPAPTTHPLGAHPNGAAVSVGAERGLHSKDRLLEWYERAIEDHLLEIEANSNKYVHGPQMG